MSDETTTTPTATPETTPATPAAPPVQAAPAAPPKPLPCYPAGLTASFDGATATVLRAWEQSGEFHYSVAIEKSIFSTELTASEPELRAKLAEAMERPPGPAYPVGITLCKGRAQLRVEGVQRDASGGYAYLLCEATSGVKFGRAFTEREIAALFGKVAA